MDSNITKTIVDCPDFFPDMAFTSALSPMSSMIKTRFKLNYQVFSVTQNKLKKAQHRKIIGKTCVSPITAFRKSLLLYALLTRTTNRYNALLIRASKQFNYRDIDLTSTNFSEAPNHKIGLTV